MRQTEHIRVVAIAVILISILIFTSITIKSYAQGLGKSQAGPVTINKAQVSVEASINPSFLPNDSTDKTLFLRAFQTGTSSNANITITKLNYRIVVSLGNSTLLDQRFSSADGVILAKLVPDEKINGWQVNGQNHSPTDQIPVSQSNPAEIRSRILVSGGVYHIAATIEKGSQGLSISSDQTFDLYVSVSQEYDFNNIRTLSGPADFKVRSYNDVVTSLTFLSNPTSNSLSLVMPFGWHSQYEASVTLVHLEVEFPKSITELQANSYEGTVNGVVLPERSLLI